VRDHKLAVIGDKGINDRVAPDLWAGVIKLVESRLAEGRSGDGLAEGIELVGVELARHFPHRADDVNELPDGVSRDEGDAPE
jgi:putative membrane protein